MSDQAQWRGIAKKFKVLTSIYVVLEDETSKGGGGTCVRLISDCVEM